MAETTRSADAPPAAAAAKSRFKTAVVVVHGMGEQRPMDTIWGLVKALWTADPDIPAAENTVYSKPDDLTGSFELRRITTRYAALESGPEKRADFYEFYWAHLMSGNTVKSVADWLQYLLLRAPRTVPRSLVFPWVSGLVLLGLTAILLSLAAAKAFLDSALGLISLSPIPPWLYVLSAVFTFLFSALATGWLAPVAGDAARYLSATPDNVAARQKIRETGVDLLQALHSCGRYDRIVVIGHSLGSVIAYDVLNLYWGRIAASELFAAHPPGAAPTLRMTELEEAAIALVDAAEGAVGPARLAYRAAQRAYQAELRKPRADRPALWLVTDFVSLGCPLSKAEVLLAHDRKLLEDKKAKREAPCCPPWLEVEDVTGLRRFSYTVETDPTHARAPHHAAAFAPVVWTNVYFPNLLLVIGDIVSGPVASQLGRGVLDVKLSIGAWAFRHLDYWKTPERVPPPRWIKALRRSANLKLRDDVALWSDQAISAEIDGDALP